MYKKLNSYLKAFLQENSQSEAIQWWKSEVMYDFSINNQTIGTHAKKKKGVIWIWPLLQMIYKY